MRNGLVVAVALGAVVALAIVASRAPARSVLGRAPVAAPPEPSLRAQDLDGVERALAPQEGWRGAAVVFLDAGCPIARQAIPELNALATETASGGIPLYGALSGPGASRVEARAFAAEFGLRFPLLLDASGDLARRLRPARTPEAFVLDASGAVAYRGRIDDRWPTIGRPRPAPTTHDLADALRALARGAPPPVTRTEAVGCIFEEEVLERPPAAPTWSREVAPILHARCASCHRPGGVAPFALLTYADARRKAATIAEVAASGLMPPWRAAPGEGGPRLVGEDGRRLSSREREVLAAWAKGGAPEGDAAEAPPPPRFAEGWALGEPDLVVEMPEAFDVPASGPDIYRTFVVPLPVTSAAFLRAIEFRPGAPAVVHHALLFLDERGRGRALDERDPGPGYSTGPGTGGVGFIPSAGLGTWSPGALPSSYPEGTGRPLRPGDMLLNIHYHPTGKAERDRSAVAVYLARPPVERSILGLWIGTSRIDIPAGEARYERSVRFVMPAPATAYGLKPHMHYLGREMLLTLALPGEAPAPLVHVRDWDFNWQEHYRFERPVALPQGAVLELTALYDNSEANPANPSRPPARVRFGEKSADEMCFCQIELSMDRGEQDVAALLEESVKQMGKVTRRER